MRNDWGKGMRIPIRKFCVLSLLCVCFSVCTLREDRFVWAQDFPSEEVEGQADFSFPEEGILSLLPIKPLDSEEGGDQDVEHTPFVIEGVLRVFDEKPKTEDVPESAPESAPEFESQPEPILKTQDEVLLEHSGEADKQQAQEQEQQREPKPENEKIWRAMAGMPLRDVLALWAWEADVVFVWESPVDFIISHSYTFEGSFTHAVQSILAIFPPTPLRPTGTLHTRQDQDSAKQSPILVIRVEAE